MGQEPNIRLDVEDLPRPTPEPAAPASWVPQRPGEMGSPDDVPWGGAFGTPGPDIGFALRIVRSMELPGSARLRNDIESAVVAVMAARASAIGRAPTAPDVAIALELLELDASNAQSVAGVAHDRARLSALVAEIAPDRLVA